MSKQKNVTLTPCFGFWLGRRDMFSICSPTLHVTLDDGTWVRFYTPVEDSHTGTGRDWIIPDDFNVTHKTARVLQAQHEQFGSLRISLKKRTVTILDQTTGKNVDFTFTTGACISGSAVSDSAILPDSLADECDISHSSSMHTLPFDLEVRTYLERKILEKHFLAQSSMWDTCSEDLWIALEAVLTELLSGKKQRNGQNEVYPKKPRKTLQIAWRTTIESAEAEIKEIYDSYSEPKNVLVQALTGRNRARKKQQRNRKRG